MDTTHTPEDGAPGGPLDAAGQPGPGEAEAAPLGSGGVAEWDDTAGDDLGYGAGYGYGPGYGDPGDTGYGYGPPQPEGPQPEAQPGPSAFGPAAAAAQVPPAVGPTPALRGYPGGPGIEPAAAEPGQYGSAGGHTPQTGSAWQRAQRFWSDSGVAWQRPVADWEPAEDEWERIQAAWTPPSRRRGRVAAPAGPGGVPGGGGAGARVAAGGRSRGDGTAGRPPISRRWILAGVAAATAVAVLIAVAFIAGGAKPAPRPALPVSPYPPASIADSDFVTSPALVSRGVFQSLHVAASYGATVVAAGSQAGTAVGRTQFFVSADGGHTWQLAPVLAPDGSQQLTSQAPTAIAAGPAGWLAIGPQVSWTSKTGQSWQLAPGPGITPASPGDQVLGVTATSTGFLAVGSAGGPATGSPVVWTSPDGRSWRRAGPGQLHLPAAGAVHGIVLAAAHGGDAVIAGLVTKTVATGTGTNRRSIHVIETDLWRSPDGGLTWTPAPAPVTAGAAAAVGGLARSATGFVLVRPGTGAKASPAAVVYTSADGGSWSYAAKIPGGTRAAPRLAGVAGSDQGAVIAVASGSGDLISYQSQDGRSWQQAAMPRATRAAFVSGLTVTAGGTVVAAGAAGVQGFLAVAGPTGVVDLTKIRGDSIAQRAVNAIVSGPGLTVAVGSANGNPAVWTQPPGGPWALATGASAGVFSRQGLSQLSGIAKGPDGWLAAGTELTTVSGHPVVVFSRDGRTWQSADGGQPFASADAGAAGVAYGPHGYVIVGSRQVGGRTVAAAWRAPALVQAAARRGPAGNQRKSRQPPQLWVPGVDAGKGDLDGADAPRSMSAITAGPFGYVAVGQHGNGPAVWLSADGRAWRLAGLPASLAAGGGLRYVAASGERIAAVGAASVGGRTVPFAAFSADGGSTWHEAGLPVPGGGAGSAGVTGLTAAAGGFVAVGTIGPPGSQDVVVFTSADGSQWKAWVPKGTGLSGPGVQQITALTTAGGQVLGAGFTATQTSEDATLWRAPPVPATAGTRHQGP